MGCFEYEHYVLLEQFWKMNYLDAKELNQP